MKRCRHCKKRVNNLRARHLCYSCYDSPAIRDLYPPNVNQFATDKQRTAAGGPNVELRVPDHRTSARPNTPEKLKVMEDRVANGEMPCHPDDERASLD